MRIATWNVNSIRTRLTQVKTWLRQEKPDLLCLQETKVDDPIFPKKELEEGGYQVFFHGQKAYNGVALISQVPLEDVRIGLTGELVNDGQAERLGAQKRVISALVNGIRVVNLYVPNGSALGTEKYKYKIEWLQCLNRYLIAQSKRDEPLCILGDFNIALEDKDIHNPEKLSGGIMASKEERDALKNILGERLQDVFRIFEPATNHWSWWNYRSGAWERDKGWRIDHIYLCEELIQHAKSCSIHKKSRGNVQPSDHAPVLAEIAWPYLEEEEEDEEQINNQFHY